MSALARTFMVRKRSAQLMNLLSSGTSGVAGRVPSRPLMTRPVVPSSEIQSPEWKTRSLTFMVRDVSSMRWSPAPATQHLPMPRVTTAAWLVMPPREVRMPTATSMPWMSSGVVSARTRITGFFLCCPAFATASAAEKTICPTAAPGRGRQAVRDHFDLLRFLVEMGHQEIVELVGLDAKDGGLLVDQPSPTMSRAMCTAARPVRLPLRVCSMYSLRSWMVNSKSCMSL